MGDQNGGNTNSGGRSGSKYDRANSFTENNWRVRFLIPARMSGCIMGKGASNMKEMVKQTGSEINLDYHGMDEKILNIRHQEKEGMIETVDLVLKGLWENFEDEAESKRPPMILVGKQNEKHKLDHFQMCMILHKHDLKTIKRAFPGSNMEDETGVDPFAHHRYKGLGWVG